MNVLITSAGRRGSLVQIFQNTLRARGLGEKVLAVDAQPQFSAACHLADASFTAPRVTNPEYVPFLRDLCLDHDVRLIVPTIDPELTVLAQVRTAFAEEGIHIAVSRPGVCETFRFKRSTAAFFAAHDFATPPIVDPSADSAYPLFAKLDHSSCSIGARRVDDFAVASQLRRADDAYVFQPFITGEEFTIDVFIDRYGELIDSVPRRRLEVRAGEVSKAVTVRDAEIQTAVKRLCHAMQGAYGVLTIQLFRTDTGLSFIEVNPRFGGGFPLSYHAGANMADYLVRDVEGESLEWQDQWKEGRVMLRYDAEVIAHDFRL